MRGILSRSRVRLKSLRQYNDFMQFILNKHMNNWTCAALSLLPCGKHLHSDYSSFADIHTLFGKHLHWHLELSAEHSAVQSWFTVRGKAVNNRVSCVNVCVNAAWPDRIWIPVTEQHNPKDSALCRVLSLRIFWIYIFIFILSVCVYLMNYKWPIYRAAPLGHEYMHNITVFA